MLQAPAATAAIGPVADTPYTPPPLPGPAVVDLQASLHLDAAAPAPSEPQAVGRCASGGTSSGRAAPIAAPEPRVALQPPLSCLPPVAQCHASGGGSNAVGDDMPGQPTCRSSAGSARSKPSVTAATLRSVSAGSLIQDGRLSCSAVAAPALQLREAAPPPTALDVAGGPRHGDSSSGKATAGAAALADVTAVPPPVLVQTAAPSELPCAYATGLEPLHCGAAAKAPVAFEMEASPARGGRAASGAAAEAPRDDSQLDPASELFAALASASEFACLADAELSQP